MAGKRKKRLRIFAGPNGSGKSTLFQNFPQEIRTGIYVNADDIEKEMRSTGKLDLEKYKVAPDFKGLQKFISRHPLLANIDDPDLLGMTKNAVTLHPRQVTSYWAAMLADYIRKKLVQEGRSLSFETVMSNPDKIEFMNFAKKKGYKIYIYFICTEDPDINIDRIHYRVNVFQGHFVLNKKVKERYYKSLELLYEAIKLSYRAYCFDNTGETYQLCAEKTPKLLKTCGHNQMPVWLYQYVLVKNFEATSPIPLRKLNP